MSDGGGGAGRDRRVGSLADALGGAVPTGEGKPLPGNLPRHPACPFCAHHETELFNAFGSQLSVATYWCRRCHTAFEFMKWGEPAQDSTSSTSSR